jgi:hypothetical protein
MGAKYGFGNVFASALGALLAEWRRTLVAKPRARDIFGFALRATHLRTNRAKLRTRLLYHARGSKGIANQSRLSRVG